MISAHVITRNEERNISACLESLAWCDEILVVDSFSTDRTVEIARDQGATVLQNAWPGYSAQRNFAIDHCRGDWLLYLDADERLSAGFREEARRTESLGDAACEGYWVNSLEYFMGDFLKFGGYGLHQANRKVRFWKNRPEHRFAGSVHERVAIAGRLGHLTAHVEHYSTAQTISGLLTKLNRYTDLEAKHLEADATLDLVVGPLKVFASRYLKHQGFRDGARGLIMAEINAFYRFVTVAKRLERRIVRR